MLVVPVKSGAVIPGARSVPSAEAVDATRAPTVRQTAAAMPPATKIFRVFMG